MRKLWVISFDLSCRWIWSIEEQSDWNKNVPINALYILGLVISAGNADELTCPWKLFAKSVACSPRTKRVWLRSSVKNGSRFIGVKGITKAPAQVCHGDLMCQMVVMIKNEWLSFHQAHIGMNSVELPPLWKSKKTLTKNVTKRDTLGGCYIWSWSF